MNRSQDVREFRQRVANDFERLESLHDRNRDASKLVSTRVEMVNEVLRDAWQLFFPEGAGGPATSLIAVGGYGREELNPHSDVDIMLLYGESGDGIEAMFQPFVRFLWDIGLEAGHSVRSVADCVKLARSDITIMTNLLEARHCTGDPELFERLGAKLRGARIWPAKKFYKAKLQEQENRHHRFTDTAYNLEPNIKDGPGGLRDIHMIGWVAARYFESRSLHDLVTHGFLSEDEYQTLIRSRNYLWLLRNMLHFMMKRREDRLLFSHQKRLAEKFDYADDGANQAIEKLMKNYFRTAKEVRHINTMLLQHFNESILARPGKKPKSVNRRFHCVDGDLDFVRPDAIKKHPEMLIEMFALLQSEHSVKGIRASALRQIRSSRGLINRQVRASPQTIELLMSIMRNPNRLPEVLERMNDTGLLGALIPEFGRVVGQMQYDMFHVYTVDAHLLFVVRNLHELSQEHGEKLFPQASVLMKRFVKPERLYIAGLFHDIAKGQDGDHSELGETSSYRFCKRMGLSEYDAHFVAWLVRHHLTMSFISQREDLNDPEVISRFAAIVGDQEHLDGLYLLTIADMRGTGPRVWNDWKGSVLDQAYAATARALLLDSPQHEQMESRVSEIQLDAQAILKQPARAAGAVKRFWSCLEDEYFLCYDADTLAWHADAATSAGLIDLPIAACRRHPSVKLAQCIVLAPAFDDLFTIITAVLDRCRLNVVEARIHPLSTGLTAFTFVILGEQVKNWASERNFRAVESEITTSIISRNLDHKPSTIAPSRAARHVKIPTTISFTHSPKQNYTMMEVAAADRPGLLYWVARTLLDFRVRLLSAKITTSGMRAKDVFFIVDRDGDIYGDRGKQQELANEIQRVLGDPAQS